MSTVTTIPQPTATTPQLKSLIKHLLPTSQLGGYSLGSALLFPVVAAAILLILTKGRLSYKPVRDVQRAGHQPAEIPTTSIEG